MELNRRDFLKGAVVASGAGAIAGTGRLVRRNRNSRQRLERPRKRQQQAFERGNSPLSSPQPCPTPGMKSTKSL